MSGRGAIRLVLADVDGTLVTDDKRLTEATRAAALALRRAGIGLAVTSGRPPRGMRMLVAPLMLDAVIAGFNGGVYVRPDLSLIETRRLEPAAARQALDLVLAAGLDAWLYTETAWLVRDKTAPHVAREERTVEFEASRVDGFTEAHLAGAVKIVGVSDDFAAVAAAEQAVQRVLGPRVSATRSQRYYLDITHPQANKGAVVQTLSNLLRVPPAEIATIGDMANDVLMFRQSGFAIAMGNASAEVKAEANVVTESNEDDGFAKAMRKFILAPGGG